MNTEAKIITRFATELTREADPVKAAWNACHALADEARGLWGDDAAATVFRVSASVIANAMAEAVMA